VQGLGYREIAEVIGISSSAVGEFLRRATERLKRALHEYAPVASSFRRTIGPLFANNPSGFISRRNTFIALMEAEFCDCYDRATVHNPDAQSGMLFERKMRTRSVIVAKVCCQRPF
jgi:hypothetical protein